MNLQEMLKRGMAYPQYVKSAIESSVETIDKLIEQSEIIEPIKKALKDFNVSVRPNSGGIPYVDVSSPTEMREILAAIGRMGYALTRSINPFEKETTSNANWLRWFFKRRGEEKESLEVQMFMMADSTKESNCRLVQVGTKTVEQPVYKMECV